jgi:Spy/CpxP family protein refolding chaperone
MKVATRVAIAVVIGLAAAPRAGAQPYKWWQDEKSRTQLGLTADQTAKIEELFQAVMPKLRTSYEELDKRETQLSALIEKAETTEAEVIRQAEQVEAMRGQLSKARTLMLFRIRRVLTPEQRVRLKEMHDGRERGRPRGPGKEQ